MSPEPHEQYRTALKAGKKYYKEAVDAGRSPYPAVLDELLEGAKTSGQVDLGVVNIPVELIAGTKTAGRTAALSGSFMPLLDADSEFGIKWTKLCEAHLTEGIRDPVKCYEYLGRFYIEEGNKRVSVLMSFGALTIPAHVIRILPERTDDREIQLYYEFVRFYSLSGMFNVKMHHRGQYATLQAALGMQEDRVWTLEEQRSFAAGFSRFKTAFEELDRGASGATAGEALIQWLAVFKFADIKNFSSQDLNEKLRKLLPDIKLAGSGASSDIFTEVDTKLETEKSKTPIVKPGLFAKKKKVAFIYAFDPKISSWTRAHDYGRQYLEQCFGDKLDVAVYNAWDRQYSDAMEIAIADGADMIFATTPAMMEACRRTAVLYKNVKILNCSPAMPYSGVITYYSRIYEAKFIAGAVAGAMSEARNIGYVADYPILGAFANINAFALGVKLTNPTARIRLHWSCLPGSPVEDLMRDGVTVISNRDATNASREHWPLEWGTYKLLENGSYEPLGVPCWSWGKMYEKLVLGIVNDSWSHSMTEKPVNLWWGLKSGVTDIQLSPSLPDGVRTLAEILKNGIIDGRVNPFATRITDCDGIVRCDGVNALSPDEIMNMDWLCDNVDGIKPDFEQLLPQSRELVRLLGVHRYRIRPETEEKQL